MEVSGCAAIFIIFSLLYCVLRTRRWRQQQDRRLGASTRSSWTPWCAFCPSISMFHTSAGQWMPLNGALLHLSFRSGTAWPWKWHPHCRSQRADPDTFSPQYGKCPLTNFSNRYLPVLVRPMDPSTETFVSAHQAQFTTTLLVVLNQWDGNLKKCKKSTVNTIKSRCPWGKVPLPPLSGGRILTCIPIWKWLNCVLTCSLMTEIVFFHKIWFLKGNLRLEVFCL